MRVAQAVKLAKLRELRALREKLAFAERVMTRRIATTASNDAVAARIRVERLQQATLHANRSEFEKLTAGNLESIRVVVSVHDAAQARYLEVENAQATLRGMKDAERTALVNAGHASDLHDQLRARVGGLDRLVSDLQAQAQKTAELVQDEAFGDLFRNDRDDFTG
jgi:hypothetical protein